MSPSGGAAGRGSGGGRGDGGGGKKDSILELAKVSLSCAFFRVIIYTNVIRLHYLINFLSPSYLLLISYSSTNI
jgi:hypothetical protein